MTYKFERLNEREFRVTNLCNKDSKVVTQTHLKRLLNANLPMASIQAINITTTESHTALTLEKNA